MTGLKKLYFQRLIQILVEFQNTAKVLGQSEIQQIELKKELISKRNILVGNLLFKPFQIGKLFHFAVYERIYSLNSVQTDKVHHN